MTTNSRMLFTLQKYWQHEFKAESFEKNDYTFFIANWIYNLTTAFPKCTPDSISINAFGIFSNPLVMVS